MSGTILVKKSDGTQVRMTMAEFAEYRKQKNTPVDEEKDIGINKIEPEPESEFRTPITDSEPEPRTPITTLENKPKSRTPIVEPVQKTPVVELPTSQVLPMEEGEHELATTAPVKNIFVDEAEYAEIRKHPAQGWSASGGKNTQPKAGPPRAEKTQINRVWTKDDNKSPLEDEVEELNKHSSLGVLPDKKDDLFAEVLKRIKFPISDNLRARLQSLITSRVKEIRDDAQFLIYVSRSTAIGGLGLKNEEADELLKIVKEVWHLANEKLTRKMSPVLEADKITIKRAEEVTPKASIFLPREKTVGKPVLHDVIKPKLIIKSNESEPLIEERKATGPIEEIKNFSLIDLRRLGDGTADNFKKLLQKFKVLKKDSIVLYFQAMQAWYESPLYGQYQNLLKKAMVSESKIKDLALGSDTLTWDEVGGIVKLEKELE